MKTSLKVLQMCLTATEVKNLGNNRYLLRWGNDRETIINVEDAQKIGVREVEVICPNCNLVIDVPVPESRSA